MVGRYELVAVDKNGIGKVIVSKNKKKEMKRDMRFPIVLEHPEMTPASLIDSATISIYKK